MSGFLDEMARSSAQRVAQAVQRESLGALERRARQTPPAPPLRLSAAGFDVIAELKLRSPAAGVLRDSAHDWLGRISAYARGGAAAVSVLTEPSRFDGSLQHLREAAAALAPLGAPAMRKDFIVDPYQVLEARAAGAGGVLIILRMLARARLAELLEVAAGHGLFVLLEAFDAADLELAGELLDAGSAAEALPSRAPPSDGHALASGSAPPQDAYLVGVNCRDLQSLEVVPERFAQLASRLPGRWPAVAESGVNSAADALRVRQLGYRVALIGTALMSRDDPGAFLAEIFDASRTVQP
jgi:indole-3-glycerol phosphate synthase